MTDMSTDRTCEGREQIPSYLVGSVKIFRHWAVNVERGGNLRITYSHRIDKYHAINLKKHWRLGMRTITQTKFQNLVDVSTVGE